MLIKAKNKHTELIEGMKELARFNIKAHKTIKAEDSLENYHEMDKLNKSYIQKMTENQFLKIFEKAPYNRNNFRDMNPNDILDSRLPDLSPLTKKYWKNSDNLDNYFRNTMKAKIKKLP